MGLQFASPAWAEPSKLALGQHLAGECTACHDRQRQAGVPAISGRPEAELLGLLKAYASGSLPGGRPANSTMVSVAQSLDEAQMAAIAGYLATLPAAKPER